MPAESVRVQIAGKHKCLFALQGKREGGTTHVAVSQSNILLLETKFAFFHLKIS